MGQVKRFSWQSVKEHHASPQTHVPISVHWVTTVLTSLGFLVMLISISMCSYYYLLIILCSNVILNTLVFSDT